MSALTVNLTQGAPLPFAITATDDDPGDTDTLIYKWELDGGILTGEAASNLDALAHVGELLAGQSYSLVATVTDRGGLFDSTAWTLNIITNYPPVAVEDTVRVKPDTALIINVLANDTDPEGDTLTVASVTDGADGITEILDGDDNPVAVGTKVRYTPGQNFINTDSFVYSISDGINDPVQATVTLTRIPWDLDVDPNQPFFYPIYGTAKRGLDHLKVGDWIGAFDNTGTCYGAGQYYNDPTLGDHRYAIQVYATRRDGSIFGNETTNMKIDFRFYINDTDEDIAAVDSQLISRDYPDIPADGGYEGADQRIDLVAAVEQKITLFPGWNFISFYVQPEGIPGEGAKIEEVFKPILAAPNDVLEYAASHEKFWYGPAGGGSLTNVDAYSSYYLRISYNVPASGVVLKITGLRVDPTHEFTLTRGWMNISYLLGTDEDAIKGGPPAYDFVGVLVGIKENIVWIKGAADENGNNWCSPKANFLKLGPGKGLFIKMIDALPDDPNDPGAVKFRYAEPPAQQL